MVTILNPAYLGYRAMQEIETFYSRVWGEEKTKMLKEWVGVPVTINNPRVPCIKTWGHIGYGVRKPIVSADDENSFITSPIGSRTKVETEMPGFWFVSSNIATKVYLPLSRLKIDNKKGVIKGKGFDGGVVDIVIRRDDGRK